MRALYLCMILIILSLVWPCYGAELDEIVVTATRIAEPRSAVPASVTVMDSSEIRMLANRNLDGALRGVQGVTILNSMGMAYGLPSQINIRGVPGLYSTLLMLDGMPLNESGSGFLSINEAPLASVSRVEVVRGPLSALYGSDAVGGVVNIVTDLPEDTPPAEISVRAGNESFIQGSVRGGAGTASLGWTIDIDARSIDNYLARSSILERYLDAGTQTYRTRMRPARNFDYEDRRAFFQLWSDAGETISHRLQLRYFESDGGYGQTDMTPLYPVPVDDTIENRTLFAGSDLAWMGKERLSVRVRSYIRGQRRTVRGLNLSHLLGTVPVMVPASADTESMDGKVDATLHYSLRTQTLTVGADLYRNQAEFGAARSDLTGNRLPLSGEADEAIFNTGLYAQDEIRFGERWVVVAGLRGDYHSEFGDAVSPKASVLLKATPGTSIRTSIGRAFRAPTLTELFQPAISFGSISFVSNSELEPEHSTAADFEIEHRFNDRVVGQVAVFYNDMEDLVVKRVDGNVLTFYNSDQAWSRGVEAGVEWTLLDGLTAFGNGTLQESRDRDTGNELDHTPETVLNLGLRVDREIGCCRGEFAVAANRTGDRGYVDYSTGAWESLDPYWRTDLSVRLTWRDAVWLGVKGDNITDENYQEWPGILQAPGRLWSIELGVPF